MINMKKLIIKKWEKFNLLTIIKEWERVWPFNKNYPKWHRTVICKCDCWNIKQMYLHNVRFGKSKSCGCIGSRNNLNLTTRKEKIYGVWTWIRKRCRNKNCREYKLYWLRGIKVCDEWDTFKCFYEDMYPTYKEWLSIDREDNNWDYCKENCRRTTQKVQCNNTRKNIYLIYERKRCPIWEVADKLWILKKTLFSRMHRWYNNEKLFHKGRLRKYNDIKEFYKQFDLSCDSPNVEKFLNDEKK